MKPGIDLISKFEKKLDENGQAYYTGTIDPANFKKLKKEIHIILMHGSLLPGSLVGSDETTQENLYMFSQEHSQQKSVQEIDPETE